VVEALTRSLAPKGYEITDISVVMECGNCAMTGINGSQTKVALQLASGKDIPGVPTKERFRIYGLRLFVLDGLEPIVHLIRENSDWVEIFTKYHHRERPPLQKERGSALVLVAQPKAGDPAARRAEAALAAYKSGAEGNNVLLQDLMCNTAPDAGGLCWLCNIDPSGHLADHYQLEKMAAVFSNGWDHAHVVEILQMYADREVRPDRVIFTVRAAGSAVHSKEDLDRLYVLCEAIRDGRVMNKNARPGSAPLSTWRPVVYVYADIHPTIGSLYFNLNRWAIALPTYSNNIGHLLAGRETTASMQSCAGAITLPPRPDVVDLPHLRAALYDALRDDSPERIETHEGVIEAFFEVFRLKTLEKYWRSGYKPVVRIMMVSITQITFDPTADFDRQEMFEDPDGTVMEGATEVTRRFDYGGSVSSAIRIGRVVILPVPLAPDVQRRILDKLDQTRGSGITSTTSLLESVNDVLIARGQRPLAALQLEATPVVGIDKQASVLDEYVPPPLIRYSAAEALEIFLRDLPGMTITPNASIPDIYPEARIEVPWVVIVGSAAIIIELDRGEPGDSEIYRALWILYRRGRIIRLRTSDIEGETFDWRSALSRALGESEDFISIQPHNTPDYCSRFREKIALWRTGHPTQWKERHLNQRQAWA
jgi:hypothetical protein